MRNSWLEMVDRVLQPARPHLERCVRECEAHSKSRQRFADERALAIANCARRIEAARAAVFAAKDGVVPSTMTELEREWRWLSRPDPDAGLMDLWASLVPASSLDRKRWRHSPSETQLDAAIALASDVENIELAEAAVDALRVALSRYGTRIGSRVRWRFLEFDSANVVGLLAEPLRVALEACPEEYRSVVLERAHRTERAVAEAARTRFPERPGLVSDLAHAALVDCVWKAARLGEPGPVPALEALWSTGYVITQVDASWVTLGMPAFAGDRTSDDVALFPVRPENDVGSSSRER